MRESRRFPIRLPRATLLLASLAVLSLVAAPAAKADVFQVNLAGILNDNMNSAGEYNGDFRTGAVPAPGGLVFNIPTTGNNAWNSAVGAPVAGNVSSGPIAVGIGGVTTVSVLLNSIWGAVGTTATVLFHGSSSDLTTTITAGTNYRDFNNDGFANTTSSPNTQLVYGTSQGGAPNGQPLHRLDMLTFNLPTAFLTQTLLSITFTDMGGGSIDPVTRAKTLGLGRIFVAGIIVQNAVPEPGPMTLAAAAAGVFGVIGYGRRYRGLVRGWLSREPKTGEING